MFGIPELDNMILPQLSGTDRTRCARVNKKWHQVVFPYIWRDIPTLPGTQVKLLASVIEDDYQHKKARKKEKKKKKKGALPPPPLPSPLSKYGPCVQALDGIDNLLYALSCEDGTSSWLPELQSPSTKEPKGLMLLRHFLRKCPGLVTLRLELIRTDQDLPRMIADVIVPQLQHLTIEGPINASSLQYILSRCSAKLVTLGVSATIWMDLDQSSTPDDGASEKREGDKPKGVLLNLKRLSLGYSIEDDVKVLAPFWERCRHVEALEMKYVNATFPDAILPPMESYMAHLNTITIGDGSSFVQLSDEDLARLFSVSTVGWRTVEITSRLANFGTLSCEALLKHSPTLQSLVLVRSASPLDIDLKQILRTCPHLRTLATLANGNGSHSDILSIDALDFIDPEPNSNSLRSWPCESSLKDLRIRIANVPCSEIDYTEADDDIHRRQNQAIQRLVYERLARFVNLEALWLGSRLCEVCHGVKYVTRTMDFQSNCLDMSLDSGLGQLKGLKRLRLLDISFMSLKVGPIEAQWMADHWPKLRTIRGLCDKLDREVLGWFQANCPRITVSRIPKRATKLKIGSL